MTTVRIDGATITDWASFHDAFAEALGFPSFYGRNMNAWIDCLSYLDEPGACMTRVHVKRGECLGLVVDGIGELRARAREQYDALIEGAAFVNWRRIEQGEPPVLALAFYLS